MNNLKSNYKVIGVMSGTSLDGIDLVCVTFHAEPKWHFEIHCFETISYPYQWKERLQNGIHLSSEELNHLDKEYTSYLAEVIRSFIKKFAIKNIEAVCSHGHTILHRPEDGITLQIGNLPQIAALVGEQVICDFRKQDVSLGGQGAPLVPIGDQLLFNSYDYCLNLGGFANASTLKDNKRIAYDICPVNIVLNSLAEKMGFTYDDAGKIAASGKLIRMVLEQLNALAYYQSPPPKSLGLEWVIKNIFPVLNTEKYHPEDLLHTFTEHCAIQLAENFTEGSSVLVTGGGVYNLYLLKRINFHKNLHIIIPDKEIIEYKEALIFGLLGVLKVRGEINCLASVTGARTDHSSGEIFN